MRYVKETAITAMIVLVSAAALFALGGQLATTEYAQGTKTIERFDVGSKTTIEEGVRKTDKRGCKVAWSRRNVTFYGAEMGWSKLEVGWCFNGSQITDKNVNFYNRVTDWGSRLQWHVGNAEKSCGWWSDAHKLFSCKSQTRFYATVIYTVGQKYIELNVTVDKDGYANTGGASGGGGGGSW